MIVASGRNGRVTEVVEKLDRKNDPLNTIENEMLPHTGLDAKS